MKRRKLILGGLIFVLLFLLLPIILARAEDPNMTGSWNGKHGQAVAGWDWDGDYGARISIVDSSGNLVQGPVDFIQDNEAGQSITAWFATSKLALPQNKLNKRQWKLSESPIAVRVENRSRNERYQYVPKPDMPRTVSTASTSISMETTRNYFSDDKTVSHILEDIASNTGTSKLTVSDLKSHNYYIMIEPLAIFRVELESKKLTLVCTATEAAKYDLGASYIFSSKIPSICYNFLPFSMYLESTSLGIHAYTGQTSDRFPKSSGNYTIVNQMGVGLIKYEGFGAGAFLHRFLDVDRDGFYTPGTDTLLNEPWPELEEKGKLKQQNSTNSKGKPVVSYVSTGTVFSPNSFWDHCKNAPIGTSSVNTRVMSDKIKTSSIMKKSVTEGGKGYSVSSAYGSEKKPEEQNGAATLDGKLLQGKKGDATYYWGLEHKVTAEKGKTVEYHFYVGYVNITDPVKIKLFLFIMQFDSI